MPHNHRPRHRAVPVTDRSATTRRLMGAAAALPAVSSTLAQVPTAAADVATPQAPAAKPGAAPVRTAATPAVTVTLLRYGSTGTLVRIAQARLGGLSTDGIFGPRTLARVKAFQVAQGIPVTGVVDAATWSTLGGFPGASDTCVVTTLRYGWTGTLVRTAQQRLGGLVVDGVFGPLTLGRVRDYQTQGGLPVTGLVDAATWSALGGFPSPTCDEPGTPPVPPTPPAPPTPPEPPVPPTPPAPTTDAPYRMPWAGGSTYRVSQAPGGAISHSGIYNATAVDFALPWGAPVEAVREGVVHRTGWMDSSGNYVLIKDASGYCQEYMHLSQINVVPGQPVGQGDLVARSGNTGNSSGAHLHFNIVGCNNFQAAMVMPSVETGASYHAGEVITSTNR